MVSQLIPLIFMQEWKYVLIKRRIYQMVNSKHGKADWISVDNLKDKDKGIGGFGHMGKG